MQALFQDHFSTEFKTTLDPEIWASFEEKVKGIRSAALSAKAKQRKVKVTVEPEPSQAPKKRAKRGPRTA
eukprot:4522098-Pyramimonas_sp.AAC.1